MPRSPIEQDFISRLNAPGETVTIEGLTISTHIEIFQQDFNCSGLILINCEIEALLFTGVKVSTCISLTSCIFSRLQFSRLIIGDSFENNSYSPALSINNCVIKSIFLLYANSIINGNVGLFHSQFKEFSIRNIDVFNDLTLFGIEVESGDIKDNVVRNSINIIGTIISNNFIIQENNTEKLDLKSDNFNGVLGILKNSGMIDMFDTIFKKGVHVHIDQDANIIKIDKCDFEKEYRVKFEKLTKDTEIFIRKSSFKESATIGKAEDIDDYHLKTINIDFSTELVGIINVSDCSVSDFIINGMNSNASLVLNNVSPQRLIIQNFTNYSNIQFFHVQAIDGVASNISILNSYLGKAQFINVDFNTFSSVSINNSFLSDIITSNVDWFDPFKLNKSESFNSNFNIKDNSIEDKAGKFYQAKIVKEIYRQLKVAMEKHGNRTDALLFQSLEMKFYEQQLKYSNRKSLLDQVILWTNNSNEHGLNWWRPVWLSLITTIILYCGIIISASNVHYFSMTCDFNKIWNSVKFLWSERGLIPQLFNPVRNLATIFKDKEGFTLTISTHVWDLCQRILISYFLFQTVSAFRKFNKN